MVSRTNSLPQQLMAAPMKLHPDAPASLQIAKEVIHRLSVNTPQPNGAPSGDARWSKPLVHAMKNANIEQAARGKFEFDTKKSSSWSVGDAASPFLEQALRELPPKPTLRQLTQSVLALRLQAIEAAQRPFANTREKNIPSRQAAEVAQAQGLSDLTQPQGAPESAQSQGPSDMARRKNLASKFRAVAFAARVSPEKLPPTATATATSTANVGIFANQPMSSRFSVPLEEIRQEYVKNARLLSASMDDEKRTRHNQTAWVDPETGKGLLAATLFPHDEAVWNRIPDIATQPMNVFLPGYAVGDRYTAILTMLVYPELKITIAYSKDQPLLPAEKQYAQEAFDIMTAALKTHGFSDEQIARRLTLAEYDGGGLRDIVETFNEPANRKKFHTLRGSDSPMGKDYSDATHLFHISATTAMMAKFFDDGDASGEVVQRQKKSGEIRKIMHALVPEETRVELTGLAQKTIEERKVQEGSVMLWITNKPHENPVNDSATARMKEAYANPQMFELIQDKLEKSGTPVVYIADGFKHVYKDRTEDRHPFRDQKAASIGKFWELSPLLKERVNQWYFIDQIFQKANLKGLVGVRSGALEPFGLLGHNVVYLEHRTMFTPERHASWLGRTSYNRLITEKTTGYLNNQTEIEEKQLEKDLLSQSIALRLERGNTSFTELKKMGSNSIKLQNQIQVLKQDIRSGVLSASELEVLQEMLDTGKTAVEITRKRASIMAAVVAAFPSSTAKGDAKPSASTLAAAVTRATGRA
jgi:hypothetical protein